jgi:hypothetical protein
MAAIGRAQNTLAKRDHASLNTRMSVGRIPTAIRGFWMATNALASSAPCCSPTKTDVTFEVVGSPSTSTTEIAPTARTSASKQIDRPSLAQAFR